MQASKRNLVLMGFSYLLGLLTAAVALSARGLLRGSDVPVLVLASAGVALVLAAARAELGAVGAHRHPRAARRRPTRSPSAASDRGR